MATLLPLLRSADPRRHAADAELLDRFATARDEAAFAELVRRHGPVVYRVCQRVVGAGAADDAFQASFLVLATRIDAARAAESVGGWLVGVAGRVARQLRRSATRRTHHETKAGALRPQERDDAPELTERFRVLDEEIAGLSPPLRDVVVLCLLQGRTQEQAAVALGKDARTLRRRLGHAKQVLRARLERRGIVPVLAAALAEGGGATAAVPANLAARTTESVFDFLTGGAGAARAELVTLAKGVAMSTMSRKVGRLVAVAVCGLIGVGVVFARDDKPTAPAPRAKLASATKAGEPQTIKMQVTMVQVPDGFCERCGLDTQPGVGGVVLDLTPRERKMFTALLRADKECSILSTPEVTVADNQTGYVQVGQDYPYVESTAQKDGKSVDTIAYRPIGASMRLTPRVSANGSILLRGELQLTTVSPGPVLKAGTPSPAFNTQSVQTTILLPDAGTAVIRFGGEKTTDGKLMELLWVVTPTLVRPDAPAKVPTPKAAPQPVPAINPPVIHVVPVTKP